MSHASIIHYFSPMSGYAYLGFRELIQIAARNAVQIEHRPVDITRVFAAIETTSPAKQSGAKLNWRRTDMMRWARRRSLVLNAEPHHWPVDATLAARCIIAAQLTGSNISGLIDEILSAVWARNEDIANESTLASIILKTGFQSETLLEKARSEEVVTAYERNTQSAIEQGVVGSPTFFVGSDMFFGQDRLDFVEEKIRSYDL